MSLNRVYAILLRHLQPTYREPMRYLDSFYWPLLDIFLFGFAGIGLLKNPDAKEAILPMLTGLVLWQIIFRANLEVCKNLLEEIWHQNLVNLFCTPLRISEWLMALMILGLGYGTLAVLFGSLMVYLLYGINIFSIGFLFIPLALSMLVSGWSVGLISSGIIIGVGRRAEMIAWSLAWFLAPFSGVLYAVEVLPPWAQSISWCLPTTYMFNEVRSLLITQKLSLPMLFKGYALNLLYFSVALAFFIFMFRLSKNKGLGRLE